MRISKEKVITIVDIFKLPEWEVTKMYVNDYNLLQIKATNHKTGKQFDDMCDYPYGRRKLKEITGIELQKHPAYEVTNNLRYESNY